MKRKLLMRVVLAVLLVGFSGCTNNEESAKKAYEDKNYNEAVKLLDQEEEKSKEAAEMYALSKAQLAIKDEAYSKALEFLEPLKGDQADELSQQCQYAITIAELSNKVVNNNAQETYDSFVKAQEVLNESNQAKLNDTMSELLHDKISEQNLDSIYYGEGLAALLKENDHPNSQRLLDSVEKSLEENAETKMKLFLMSTNWIRQDGTNLEGTILKVQFSDDEGFATIEETIANQYGFVAGDIKWKNIKFISENKFRHEELSKGSAVRYREAIGTINYGEKSINVHITADSEDNGIDQVLVATE